MCRPDSKRFLSATSFLFVVFQESAFAIYELVNFIDDYIIILLKPHPVTQYTKLHIQCNIHIRKSKAENLAYYRRKNKVGTIRAMQQWDTFRSFQPGYFSDVH